jgi:hypothetical protein
MQRQLDHALEIGRQSCGWEAPDRDLAVRSIDSHKIEFSLLNGNLMVPAGGPPILSS